jgi:myo-inositol-1(or 4)-monophosphatase
MTDIEIAIAVAEAGAEVVCRRFGAALERFDKGAGDFATNADVEAERVMRTLLQEQRPHDKIFGEEGGESGPGSSSRIWLIDPLCGTVNYAVRMRVAAVNVVLMDDREFIAAAVADPFNEETFFADGRSAFLRSKGRDEKLVPDSKSRLVDLNFDPPFPNAAAFKAAALAATPEFAVRFRPRVVSTTIALTWVATGQRAAYITDGEIMEKRVHFAAGLAICEAAGCVVTDLWGERWGNGATGLVACADRETHAVLMNLIAEMGLTLKP